MLSSFEKGCLVGEPLGRDCAVRLISNLSHLRGVVERPLTQEQFQDLERDFFREVELLPGLQGELLIGDLCARDREWNLGLVRGYIDGLCEHFRRWDYSALTIST